MTRMISQPVFNTASNCFAAQLAYAMVKDT
jgi:hypothetical protein